MVIRPFRILPLILGVVALGGTPPASAQQPGAAAPPLSIETLLQAPEGTSTAWADLKGKVVVVEFWATWCAPCIASVPHWNDLVRQFQGEPIVFLSITDEPRTKVEPFLQRRPIAGWVGLDTDGGAGPAYGITSIPQTFLIDRAGKVLGRTHPDGLTADHLRQALRGEPVEFKVDAPSPTVPAGPAPLKYASSSSAGRLPAIGVAKDEAPEPLAQVIIRPALEPDGGGSSGGAENRKTWINIDAAGLVRGAYSDVYDVPSLRVDLRAKLPDRRLDAAVWAPPGDPKTFRRLVEAGIGGAFGLTARLEEREVDVFELKVIPGATPKLSPTASTGGSMSRSKRENGRLIASSINQTMAGLASTLEGQMETTVIDRTELPGGYDIDLTVPRTAEEARAVLQPLGLELVPTRLKLKFVVVEPEKS